MKFVTKQMSFPVTLYTTAGAHPRYPVVGEIRKHDSYELSRWDIDGSSPLGENMDLVMVYTCEACHNKAYEAFDLSDLTEACI